MTASQAELRNFRHTLPKYQDLLGVIPCRQVKVFVGGQRRSHDFIGSSKRFAMEFSNRARKL